MLGSTAAKHFGLNYIKLPERRPAAQSRPELAQSPGTFLLLLPFHGGLFKEKTMTEAVNQLIKREVETVVIGAGNGGLTAAVKMAAMGKEVLLLEQHNLPGGFATSFRRGRFEFEASLHQIADIGPSSNRGSVREFFEDELGVFLDWAEVPEGFRLIITDPEQELDVTMPYGVDAFIEALEREVPGSREPVTRYLNLCRELLEGIAYVGKSRGQPDKKLLLTKYASLLNTAPYTVDEVADALNVPERARHILHAQWSYLGPPTSRASFTIYGAMLYKFLLYGAVIPRHTSHEISLALDARLRELGGSVLYNTQVEKILVRDGHVEGVVTSRGDQIRTNHVIANVSPTLVYNHLFDPAKEVPPEALQECNARVDGVSAFVVYMGLDAPPDELGLKEYSYFVYRSMDTTAGYESFSTLDTPKMQAVVCINNAVPDCSPPGTSIVTITSLFQPETWNIPPDQYVSTKNRIAEGLIRDLEEATGTRLREHIEEFAVATPQTFARYTGAHNGIIYGYEPEPWDSLLPRMMMMDEDQHVQGLQFCGGSAFRCHGYSSSYLSGQIAALLTLRDIREEGGLRS